MNTIRNNEFSKSSFRIGIDARLWNETGVGRYIRNLVFELQKIDTVNEYVLFVLEKDRDQVKFHISNSKFQIRVVDIPWHTLQEQWEFPKILERTKVDLVHFPYFSIPMRYKGKYICTMHDLILHHFPTGKASTHGFLVYWAKQIAYRYSISQAAKKAEKIITVSNATKNEIIKHLHVPAEKVIVTYEGIDAKIQNTKPDGEIFPKKYFLYVGNAYPHKNLQVLLDAFVLVNARHDDVALVFVGKKDFFYSRLERSVAALHLSHKILFDYNVSDEKLAAYYAGALGLVLPSLMEGFGLPLLEAMAKGCLVVASDIPVFHELAGDVPLYFPSTDVNTLSNMLESIAIGREQHAKKRKAEGKIQAKKFSWKKMAEETQKVYQSCFRL